MSLLYELMYLLRLVPWDREWTPAPLKALVQGPQALPAGRALDLGCGYGRHAIYLARQGWQVTGVDGVERALRTARRRAAAAGVQAEFRRGDVTRLDACGVTGPYDLLLDSVCFHGLPEPDRPRYGASVSAVAEAGATLLLFALPPARRGPGPFGADPSDVERHLAPSWRLVASDLVNDHPRGNSTGLRWYRLQRN